MKDILDQHATSVASENDVSENMKNIIKSNISVSGQHIALGESLTTYVNTRADEVIRKYFDRIIAVNVHFAKSAYHFTCSIVLTNGMHFNTHINSNAECNDIYSSFDQALARLEKQLRKYKSKLKHHHKTKISENIAATKRIIAPHWGDDSQEDGDHTPVTIAEKSMHVHTMSVSDAIMAMDLQDIPAMMFRNSQNGRMNIVYYRRDGHISWVDSDQ
jgi:ribosomal subunit interface protein